MVGKVGGVLSGLAVLCASTSVGMSDAAATTPDPGWMGVQRLHILAHLTGPVETALLGETFCARVQRIAAEGAPIPVQCVDFGTAHAAETGAALIVVQAAVQPIADSRILIVTARRTASAGLEPAPILLGATPRATRLSGVGTGEAADRALREALAEILPWLGEQP